MVEENAVPPLLRSQASSRRLLSRSPGKRSSRWRHEERKRQPVLFHADRQATVILRTRSKVAHKKKTQSTMSEKGAGHEERGTYVEPRERRFSRRPFETGRKTLIERVRKKENQHLMITIQKSVRDVAIAMQA